MNSLIILCALLTVGTAFVQYGDPIVINMPINTFTLDRVHEHILVASDNHILILNTNGTVVDTISINSALSVSYIDVSKKSNLIVSLSSDNLIRIYQNRKLKRTIQVTSDYGGIWFDDVHNLIISSKYVYHEKAHNYWSTIKYFNLAGDHVHSQPVNLSICDLVMNMKTGDLIFDSFLTLEPAVIIEVTNMTSVITQINTTRPYPCNGLALNRHDDIISAGYGLDLYTYDGIVIKHLGNNMMVFSPRVYESYIAYLDLFSDDYKPFIQFIDYEGNNILKVPYTHQQLYSGEHAYFEFMPNGAIIASIDNQMKIWNPV